MTLFEYCMQFLSEICEGKRLAPAGFSLPEGGEEARAAALQAQIRQAGVPAFVRACAAESGLEIPQSEYDAFGRDEPPAAPPEAEPVRSEVREIYEVFLDSVCLDDDIFTYLIDVLKRRDKQEFETLSHAAARTILDMSDSNGYIVDKNGIDLPLVKQLKEVERKRIREYVKSHPEAEYHEGCSGIWQTPCDIALPCATQNELDGASAQALIRNGCFAVAEGANMDIKGSLPGYSCFLSRFTHAEELVCVTLLANKEGVDFTNLGRRIAGAFGDLLSTNYDDNRLFLYESQFPAEKTVQRLEAELQRRGIPLFARFDHVVRADVGVAEHNPDLVVGQLELLRRGHRVHGQGALAHLHVGDADDRAAVVLDFNEGAGAGGILHAHELVAQRQAAAEIPRALGRALFVHVEVLQRFEQALARAVVLHQMVVAVELPVRNHVLETDLGPVDAQLFRGLVHGLLSPRQ